MMERVRLVRAAERRPGHSTPGMTREEAFATDAIWAGMVKTEPDMVSGWHHHGYHETAIYVLSGRLVMESGPGGSQVLEAEPGDFLHVPRAAVHRESNPSENECVAVVLRAGSGDVVVNVKGPER
jgi:uncharacterized RmlC-like cupin family protein